MMVSGNRSKVFRLSSIYSQKSNVDLSGLDKSPYCVREITAFNNNLNLLDNISDLVEDLDVSRPWVGRPDDECMYKAVEERKAA